MAKALPKLIRDTREHKGKGYKWRATSTVAGTVEKKLDQGDYSIEGMEEIAVVERKGSASELLSNMLTVDRKRFHATLERLSKLKYKWIVCDFTFEDLMGATKRIPRNKRHFFSEEKIVGAVASIMAKYGVPIIFCGPAKQRKLKNPKGAIRNIIRGKDLTKKLLLKAYKYHGIEKATNTE